MIIKAIYNGSILLPLLLFFLNDATIVRGQEQYVNLLRAQISETIHIENDDCVGYSLDLNVGKTMQLFPLISEDDDPVPYADVSGTVIYTAEMQDSNTRIVAFYLLLDASTNRADIAADFIDDMDFVGKITEKLHSTTIETQITIDSSYLTEVTTAGSILILDVWQINQQVEAIIKESSIILEDGSGFIDLNVELVLPYISNADILLNADFDVLLINDESIFQRAGSGLIQAVLMDVQ